MKKSTQLNSWLWQWHFIAGLITVPFILLLSITGIIYLFKPQYEASAFQSIKQVEVGQTLQSYDSQYQAVLATGAKPNKLILPSTETQTSEFKSGRFSNSASTFVNPYTAEITGSFAIKDTGMQKVRKLHGELLLGKVGTKIIELVASWFFVLILSGLFLWWPKTRFALKGLFIVRFSQGKRILMRDLHAVIGFWTSLFLVIMLSGGLPWTDVFGGNFKTLKKLTDSGYPQHWSNSQGLNSDVIGNPLSIDSMAAIAVAQNLEGVITLTLPQKDSSVFSVSNRAINLSDQQVKHFDRYSGALVKKLDWSQVGIMDSGRQVVMRIHTGEFFGLANWLLVLATAALLALSCIAIVNAYLIRKPENNLGIPAVPGSFKVGPGLMLLILFLGLFLPLFGASVLAILVGQLTFKLFARKRLAQTS